MDRWYGIIQDWTDQGERGVFIEIIQGLDNCMRRIVEIGGHCEWVV